MPQLINQVKEGVKGFWNSKTQETDFQHIPKVSLLLKKDDFILATLNQVLNNFILDLLRGVKSKDKNFLIYPKLTKPYKINNDGDLYQDEVILNQLSLYEIILNSYIYGEYTIYQINGVFVESKIRDEFKVQGVQAKKAYKVESPLLNGLKEILQMPLTLLYYTYDTLFQDTQLNNKVVYRVSRMNEILANTQSGSDFQMKVEKMKDEAREIFKKENQLLVMDAVNAVSTLNIATTPFAECVNFVYDEMARILGIPRTKLIGEQTTGLGNEGKGDYNNYDEKVESIREALIFPFMKENGGYTTENLTNKKIASINSLSELLFKIDGIEGGEQTKKEIIEKMSELMGGNRE